ncbi:hypothetical protein [Pseudomonas sp. EMN2]|uniref:hypothetical protein n=1 Tax=Pseudomonas sp. EMN2 TaxID=2615212 RepID=UPI00129C05BA|nr:hypothetical protein [Pseudomonas sp. EMN2]
MSKLAGLFTLAALLSACTVGPDYQAPSPAQFQHFTHDQAPGDAPDRAVASNEKLFWQGFEDPVGAGLPRD